MTAAVTRAQAFRELHAPGRILVLPNAWDAGSARFIESCGAPAIATTSAGVAWAHGYPDGNALPARVLASAVAEIARVLTVPLSLDFEAGYSADPRQVGERLAPVLDAGAVGINIEDGGDPADLLCAKIGAVKEAARARGVELFVNARTDVYLKRLVPAERALDEALARGQKYLAAGADGLFVPALAEAQAIRTLASEIPLPLNLMIVPGLAPVAELQSLGVRRVSAGSALAQSAFAQVRRATQQLLKEGRFELLTERGVTHPELNGLFRA
ncbi:MAG TPA: isocitrate lyase/phosphoenolpyruvate mutase family protein [Myxococcota bacterium]|nr:isocitrate lyase/phosphoenolpyruvate mutase family protein [Myxococcota bacterium]